MNHHAPASSSARPLDTLLAEYAAGTLPRPLHALVGAHLDLNPDSECFVGSLELLRGAEMEKESPAPVSSRDRMLASILAVDAATPHASDEPPADPVFTPALRRYLGMASSEVPWRRVLPGVREHVVHDADGVEAKLYWIKAGRKIPSHTHEGQEFTIVLKGGFTDVSGHFCRGDVVIADEDVDHKPVADSDEDCICFAVTDAPLKLTGPVGKVFQSIFRN